MKPINDKFYNFLKKQGFKKAKIFAAWKYANHSIYTDTATLEIMTKDLLTRKDALQMIRPFLRKNQKKPS